MNERSYTPEEVTQMARRAYREGRATFELDPRRSALLTIDMQDEFVRPGWTAYWVPEATRIIPRVARLIAFCRTLAIPVIYTAFARTHHRLDRPEAGAAMPNRFPFDSEDWFRDGHIVDDLKPQPDDVVIFKPSYGAFYDTPLQTILKNLGRDTIIICGTLTNFCCGTTARQGFERGFNVVFGSDVTATDDPEMQEPELQVLRKGFALVLTADEIESQLRTASNSPLQKQA
jgi:nicotinamidase-related amidase